MPDKEIMLQIQEREQQRPWTMLDPLGFSDGDVERLQNALAWLAEDWRATAELYDKAKGKGFKTLHVEPLRHAARQLDDVIKGLSQPRRAPLGQLQPPAPQREGAGLDEPQHRFKPGDDQRTCDVVIDGLGCGRFASHPAHRLDGPTERPGLDALIAEAAGPSWPPPVGATVSRSATGVLTIDGVEVPDTINVIMHTVPAESIMSPEQIADMIAGQPAVDAFLAAARTKLDALGVPDFPGQASGDEVAAYLAGVIDDIPGAPPLAPSTVRDRTEPKWDPDYPGCAPETCGGSRLDPCIAVLKTRGMHHDGDGTVVTETDVRDQTAAEPLAAHFVEQSMMPTGAMYRALGLLTGDVPAGVWNTPVSVTNWEAPLRDFTVTGAWEEPGPERLEMLIGEHGPEWVDMTDYAKGHLTSARELKERADAVNSPIPPVPLLSQPGDAGSGYAPTYVPPGAVPATFTELLTPVPYATLPPHLSHSQASTLADCPAKYRLQRLDRVHAGPDGAGRAAPVVQIPQWAQIGGSAFHAAAEEIERTVIANPDADPLPLLAANVGGLWRTHFDAEVQKIEASSPVPRTRWRASKQGAEGETWWNANGPKMLERYLAARPVEPTATLHGEPHGPDLDDGPAIEIELNVTVPTAYGPIEYRAILDRVTVRVDQPTGAATLIIRDYKTGDRMPDDTSQLGEYANVLRLLGVPPHVKILGTFFNARKGVWTPEVDLDKSWPADWFAYVVTTGHARKLALTQGPTSARPSSFCGGCSVRYACPIKGVQR